MMSREQALAVLREYYATQAPAVLDKHRENSSFTDFTEANYYIVGSDGKQRLVKLMQHQKAILEYALDPANDFTTIVYSTVKKSGKTAVAAMVARWIAETWGLLNEIYMIANDLEQAKGRAYKSLVQSIELDPKYNRLRRELPDKWDVKDKESIHVPSGSIVRSLAGDYKGEAGGNPTATFWSELWGYTSENSTRMWDELTPVPTRERSLRFVETYAGFEQESILLWDLYQLGKKEDNGGVRIDLPGWPFEDLSPTYVNRQAKLFMYWDDGPLARRMPWQTPEYYAEQGKSLRRTAFDRLHLNYWGSSSESFMPIEWWDGCYNEAFANVPLTDKHVPVVIGVDASVSHDTTSAVAVRRHPLDKSMVVPIACAQFFPPAGGTINYGKTIEPLLKDWCKRWNVVQIAYDPYQMHKQATDLREAGIAWMRPFDQGAARLRADKQCHDMIRDRMIEHGGIPEIRAAILQANAKVSADEDTRFRIVKKTPASVIDPLVALSMAVSECLRLSL